MPLVRVDIAVPRGEPEQALRSIFDFECWPELSESVLSVRGDEETTFWEVAFREGVLKWSQRDRLDADAGVGRFDLIEGDPLAFSGTWRVAPNGDGCTLTFDAEFDLGMPSLGHVLDPMAVEALEDAVASVARGLFGDTVEIEFGSPTTEGAA